MAKNFVFFYWGRKDFIRSTSVPLCIWLIVVLIVELLNFSWRSPGKCCRRIGKPRKPKLLAAVACWWFVWVFQFHHVFSRAWHGRDSGKNGHRNISRSTFYWCKWDIKFKHLQKVYHIGNRITDALCYTPYGNRIFTFKLVSYYQPVKISKAYEIV